MNCGATDVPANSPASVAPDVQNDSPGQQQAQEGTPVLDTGLAQTASAQNSPALGMSPELDTTPAHQQPTNSSLHLGLSAYGTRGTAQGDMGIPMHSPIAQLSQRRKITPHFREMQVPDRNHAEHMTAKAFPGLWSVSVADMSRIKLFVWLCC